ncbi:MAG: metallophosphoesterase family protein [Actinomycetota bacterium]
MGERKVRIFYAADIHGSDRAFRKWVNAAAVYGVDALVFGGDIAGKIVVPIVRHAPDRLVAEIHGEEHEVAEGPGLEELRSRIRASGRYDVVLDPDQKRAYDEDPGRVADELFPRLVRESVRGWVELAEERLAGTDVQAFMMLGNDDYPELEPLLAGRSVRNVEHDVVELPGGFEMISLGYSNRTPWDSPRELDEEDLAKRIDERAERLTDPEHAVFNLHVPPHDTHLDQAALLDGRLRPRVEGGQIVIGHVGSTAVRAAEERYRPLLGLHGHIHESPGAQRLGRTVIVNPGSDYGDGILRGALITLDRRKGVRSWQLVQG